MHIRSIAGARSATIFQSRSGLATARPVGTYTKSSNGSRANVVGASLQAGLQQGATVMRAKPSPVQNDLTTTQAPSATAQFNIHRSDNDCADAGSAELYSDNA